MQKTCKKTEDHATRYVFGEISGLRRYLFRRHIAVCSACRDAVTEINASIQALKSLPEPEISSKILDEIRLQAGGIRPRSFEPFPLLRPAAVFLTLSAVLMVFVISRYVPRDYPSDASRAKSLAWDQTDAQIQAISDSIQYFERETRTAREALDSTLSPGDSYKNSWFEISDSDRSITDIWWRVSRLGQDDSWSGLNGSIS